MARKQQLNNLKLETMKRKILFTLVLLLTISILFAQEKPPLNISYSWLYTPTGIITQGNLGIKTTTSDYPLHVVGETYLQGNVGINRAPRIDAYKLSMGGSIHMYNNSMNYVHQVHFNDNVRFYDENNDSYLNFKYGDTGAGGIKFYDGNGTRQGYIYSDGNATNPSFGLLDGDGNWGVQIRKDDYVRFLVNNSEKMRINSLGKIGIGISLPTEIVHLKKSDHTFIHTETATNGKYAGVKMTGIHNGVKATSQIYMDYYGGSAGKHGMNYISGRSGFANHWFKDDQGTVQLGITDNGRVGIGTISPTKKLDVNGDINLSGDLYKEGVLINLSGEPSVWKLNGSNAYYNDGNVGIGTNNPTEKLQVEGNIRLLNSCGDIKKVKGIYLGWSSNYGIHFQHGLFSTDGTASSDDVTLNSFGNIRLNFDSNSNGSNKLTIGHHTTGLSNTLFTILEDGNVGIGIESPSKKLEVGGDINFTGNLYQNDQLIDFSSVWNQSGSTIYYNVGNVGIGIDNPTMKLDVSGDINYTGDLYKNGQLVNLGSFWNNNGTSIYYNGGNVGIGAASPIYLFSVKGTIGCDEVVVEDVSGWADFVFEDDYNLMSIEELESFVIENNHLPEIPTTKEVEENGISIGEMNAKLLQKIEELTLYVIELQKTNKEQSHAIDELKALIK